MMLTPTARRTALRSLGWVPLCMGLFACSSAEPPAPPQSPSRSQNEAFDALAARFVDESTRFSPVDATRQGDHRRDRDLDDLSSEGVAAELAWDREMLAALEAIDTGALTRANQVDAAMLGNVLRADVWNFIVFERHKWDPLLYNDIAGGAIYNLMARDYAPLAERLEAATARLGKLADFYEIERANLDLSRVPQVYAEQARDRNPGVLSLIDEFLKPNVDQLSGAARDALLAAIASASAAVEAQQRWIENELLPNAKGEFRIGAKLFDEQLAFTLQSPLDRPEIRRRAEAELARVRAEMYDLAREALAGRVDAPPLSETPSPQEQQAAIQAALELAAAARPPRDGLVDYAKRSLQQATEFVEQKNLISVPNDPIEIILMPEFQRGFAVAYCDPPGPLDAGQKTFYAISPIPAGWDRTRADSFLREYNDYAIQDITFHEAMPGHYVQLAYSNRYPSTLRALLGSGSFIEGWGVYAERIVTDAGYLDDDPLMRLSNRKLYLRTIANAILDQAIHVDGMTRDEAMRLMMHDTFQEEREAAGKWIRAELSSTQLSTYFVGFQEHWDLRHEAEARAGTAFELRAYNDRVVSFGSPPVRYVRALMFDLPIEP